jgi:predicted deacylase
LGDGRRVTLPAWVVDSGEPGPSLLLLAAQHGNEVQGIETIRRFVDMAARSRMRGRMFAVPFANILAIRDRRPHIRMAPEQAYADHRGYNMNSLWPGSPTGNDIERLTDAITRAFADEATHLLDLHCWARAQAPGLIIRRGMPELRQVAGQLGCRFVNVWDSPLDAPNITAKFRASGRIALTYECSGQYLVAEGEVRKALRVATNLARLIGLLPGRLLKGDDPVLFADEVRQTKIRARHSGLFVGAGLAVGSAVGEGELLGHVFRDTNLATEPVRSPVAGYLRTYGLFRPHADVALPAQHPYVDKGDLLATVWSR